VGTAALTALLYIVLHFALGVDIVLATAVAVLFGFGFRLLSLYMGWEEWEPSEPDELRAGEKAHHSLSVDIHEEFEER
jgi:hypothetical protein